MLDGESPQIDFQDQEPEEEPATQCDLRQPRANILADPHARVHYTAPARRCAHPRSGGRAERSSAPRPGRRARLHPSRSDQHGSTPSLDFCNSVCRSTLSRALLTLLCQQYCGPGRLTPQVLQNACPACCERPTPGHNMTLAPPARMMKSLRFTGSHCRWGRVTTMTMRRKLVRPVQGNVFLSEIVKFSQESDEKFSQVAELADC